MNKRGAFHSLRDFIDKLDELGELVRIQEEVDPNLEITQITDIVSKSNAGGRALYFENVKGSSMPLLINAFGSTKRMALSLGVDDVEEIADDIRRLINIKQPESIKDKLQTLPLLYRLSKFPPKLSTGMPPCQEVVLKGDNIDLDKLPILKCWPQDGGKFITLPLVITKSLHKRERNVGVYRMQVFDERTTGMHWHIHKDGAHFFHDYKKNNKKMEIAVAIGTDPAIIYAATAPLPLGVDELSLAGFINNRPVELTKCITIDLEVPKNAEIILEGYVDPSEKRIEGPFGDHTGYYSLADEYPIFHLTAITHRKNPIYVTTIVGKPPMEDCYMGKATERIFLPLLQKIHPEIIDYNLPWEGVFHNCVIVSIDKRYPAQAKKIMSALWGAGQMAFAKMILIVDSDINVADYNAVARRALSTINISSDLQLSKGILDVLDHSSPTANHGYKIGVDATRKFKEEIEVTPNNLDGDATLFSSIATKLDFVNSCTIPYTDLKNRLAIISIKKSEPLDGINFGKQLVDSDHDSINIFLILDSHVDSSDYSVALWKLFNNVDPKIDMIHYKNRLIIDATMKFKEEGHPREWPDEIVMDQDIVELVNRKWSKYNIGGK